MRMLVLPGIPELAACARLAVGHEDRVVAEPAAPARRVGDASVGHARAAQDLAVRTDRHELRHVTSAPVRLLAELAEQLRDRGRALGRIPRGRDARTAAERRDLDAGVLADRPPVGRDARATEPRLGERVLVVRLAGLRRIVVGVEHVDRPAGKQLLELARLVRVARAENGVQSVQRTSSTPSMSATCATIRGAVVCRSSTSIAMLRRSPSCAISIETTRPPVSSITSITGAGLPPAGTSTRSRSISGRKRRTKRNATIRSGPRTSSAPTVEMTAAL